MAFAWMTEQYLFRLNQVPEKNYVTFLDLIGARLESARPAKGDVTFTLAAAPTPERRIVVPAWTEVATERTEADDLVLDVFDQQQPFGAVERELAAAAAAVDHLLDLVAQRVLVERFGGDALRLELLDHQLAGHRLDRLVAVAHPLRRRLGDRRAAPCFGAIAAQRSRRQRDHALRSIDRRMVRRTLSKPAIRFFAGIVMLQARRSVWT